MKLKNISNIVTSKLGRQVLVARKHSPTLLFGAGVVGVISATVLACRATLKLEEVLDDHRIKTEKAESLIASGHKDYSETEFKRDMLVLHARTFGKITKLYGPAIIVGGLSIAALTGSFNILNKRNAALTAAYATLEKGFKEYRKRVVDEFGEEKDRELRYGSLPGETELSTQDENGNSSSQKVKVLGGKNASIYARFFDESNPNWNRSPNYNQMFIRAQQSYANDLLKARGHLFLNDVYDMLGMERSKEGAVVGWVLGNGDDFIDFGIFRKNDIYMGQEFVNGNTRSILLDFNVDGVMYDKI